MLQNARVRAFTVFELLTEKQHGVKLPFPTQIRVNSLFKVKIFNHFPSLNFSSSHSSGEMSDKSTDSFYELILYFQTRHRNYVFQKMN